MLITSGQVSVAISSGIVFLFTTALFLSGYVLQQATVRDLRAAIKPQLNRPKPGPDLYLPPQFTEDGYLVDVIKVETQNIQDEAGRDALGDRAAGSGGDSSAEGDEQATDEASDDMVGATRWQKAARKKKTEEARQRKEQELQHPISNSGSGDSPGGTPPIVSKPQEKPISAAERRRRIKEQIVAEGEGEGFKGYRRRMW
ncbi:uncharacterized protein L3040_008329 [Drepanopeziza brunnea f. sp. 'multigermtubi']|uniref:Uncharacterized protein n=1 Tax=Marssonina brunnea f. sp. multigermtubi (strain MB_m1) TaxID=1072389 RepID=K1XP94_MARBU|nr:uncharacterized protein MBM_07549 [Drepanopeziza brunnea f. sp. 'multigermtubi' MB_m1]EKD14319.1 hypothetical protein MBM_07549 [Drepanopeziza brunnea f. sp. 'multigermtubi' MB_m1]KAJ5035067.1 hypothetical protein L3040_008329 [Drepanopeziza brunnea f. sp. 'multigermtubi']